MRIATMVWNTSGAEQDLGAVTTGQRQQMLTIHKVSNGAASQLGRAKS